MTWRIFDPCQICLHFQNHRKGSFNTTAEHLSENNLIEMRQSAYRKKHSTETALLSVVGGLLRNADNRLVSVSALLDLIVAFDTLSRPSSIVTEALEHFWRFWHCASLICILLRRPWTVCDGWQCLVLSQPPSVQGPTEFSSWASPVHTVLQAPLWLDMSPWVWLWQIRWWCPVVKGVPPDQLQSLLCDIQTCIESLVGWMYSNKLKLNAEKYWSSSHCLYLLP